MQTSTTKTLSGKQARFLRGLGHSLRPAVMIGRQELTETILTSLDESLTAHELVKVKLQEGCLLDRREAAAQLAAATGAAVAQVLGKTILLYRPSDKKLITLP
ncbi:MAG: ribosome assembly RNA-binding protein YhbY [Desulfuromonadales bacterium]